MASPLGHTLGGLTLYLLTRRDRDRPLWSPLAAMGVILAANAPDLDFLPGLILDGDASLWHHRLTHSLVFALLVCGCVLAACMLQKNLRKAAGRASLLAGGLVLLHLALDLVTEDTSPPIGMQLYWPFSRVYVLAPWAFLDSVPRVPVSLAMLGTWARLALKEGVLLGVPFIAVLLWRVRTRGTANRTSL